MAKKKEEPEIVELTEVEASSLLDRLQASNLDEKDKWLLAGVLKANLWLRRKFESGKIGFYKLASLLFGKKTEKTGRSKGKSKEETPDNHNDKSASSSDEEEAAAPKQNSDSCSTDDFASKKRKGHGRLPASAYQSDEDIYVDHPDLKSGDACPQKCGGRLYEREPGVLIRLKGQSWAKVVRHFIQSLRCSTCGSYVHIPLPESARGPKYDAQFTSILAVQKYSVAVPFYRQEAFLKLTGLPLADATQWMLMEELAECVAPVIPALESVAARGDLICNDDTRVIVLDVVKANKNDLGRKRTGMFTTGIYARSEGKIILLFYSGVLHAGENLALILEKRPKDLPPIIHMCDALSHNLTHEFRVVLCHCLAHARRKFKDLETFFPLECFEILEAFGLIYKHEAETKEKNLSAGARLIYHQKHSRPVMDKLKAYLLATQPLTEPNGDLYKSMAYLLKHWKELTAFLHVSGALLDNNLLEAALKLPVRIRKNSLFHRSLKGARVASILMSLIDTCRANRVNPIEYLIALQNHASAVARDPDQWLPWTYEETLKMKTYSSSPIPVVAQAA